MYIGDFVWIVCSMINKYRLLFKICDNGDFSFGYKMLIKFWENVNVLK